MPPHLETAAAYVMVAGGVLTTLLHFRLALDPRWPLLVRGMWLASAAGLGFSMERAAMYAARFFADVAWLIIPKMAALHGTANAVVFTLVGIVAWRIALAREVTQQSPPSEV